MGYEEFGEMSLMEEIEVYNVLREVCRGSQVGGVCRVAESGGAYSLLQQTAVQASCVIAKLTRRIMRTAESCPVLHANHKLNPKYNSWVEV